MRARCRRWRVFRRLPSPACFSGGRLLLRARRGVRSRVVTPAVDSRVALTADGRGASTTYEVSYRSEISSLGSADSSVSARVGFEDAWFIGGSRLLQQRSRPNVRGVVGRLQLPIRARMFDRGDAVVSLENLPGLKTSMRPHTKGAAWSPTGCSTSWRARRTWSPTFSPIVRFATGAAAMPGACARRSEAPTVASGSAISTSARRVSHEGFSRASAEVEASLDAYLSWHHLDGEQVKASLDRAQQGEGRWRTWSQQARRPCVRG